MELRTYQSDIASKANVILESKGIVCLFMHVRTGKTLTALETCKLSNATRVLFITKIKAFSSIENDYHNMNYEFELTTINKESLHKVKENDFDIVILDEVHQFTAYPKPSKFTKDIKSRFANTKMIMLSGTPTPESFSQYYHLFWMSNYSPFKHKNFYSWAKEYVNVIQKDLGFGRINNYSDARKEEFMPILNEYILTFTQEQAGFTTSVQEEVLEVEMKMITYDICNRLKRDRVVKNGAGQVILADTGGKMMGKLHQLYSGTCKFEDGSSKVIDNSKAEFIKWRFEGQKIGIFYKFKEELIMLQDVFGNKLTTDLDEFNRTDKNIALQFQSGREGLSLRNADCLVALNIDFSATTYFQFKDRMTTLDRTENKLYWIFATKGIENKIYRAVQNKKNFTLEIFRQC